MRLDTLNQEMLEQSALILKSLTNHKPNGIKEPYSLAYCLSIGEMCVVDGNGVSFYLDELDQLEPEITIDNYTAMVSDFVKYPELINNVLELATVCEYLDDETSFYLVEQYNAR